MTARDTRLVVGMTALDARVRRVFVPDEVPDTARLVQRLSTEREVDPEAWQKWRKKPLESFDQAMPQLMLETVFHFRWEWRMAFNVGQDGRPEPMSPPRLGELSPLERMRATLLEMTRLAIRQHNSNCEMAHGRYVKCGCGADAHNAKVHTAKEQAE